jgi:hypothetical protein
MDHWRHFLISLALLCAGCASCPSGTPQAPWFYADKPLRITAHVDSFLNLGAFIDWSNDFVSYHSVDLLIDEPSWIGWKRVRIQFLGAPMLNGQHLELGQRLSFTLPPTKPDDCCAPYLSEIKDAVFLEAK